MLKTAFFNVLSGCRFQIEHDKEETGNNLQEDTGWCKDGDKKAIRLYNGFAQEICSTIKEMDKDMVVYVDSVFEAQ